MTPCAPPPRISYRPGDRGVRRPITANEVARAIEYRALGLSWSQTAAVLRRNKTSVRAAVVAGEASSCAP